MAVYKFSNVGGFGTYQRYNDFLAGNPAVIQDAGAYFPLGEFTLASAQSSITFSNIPQTYKHLQIRAMYTPSTAMQVAGYFNGSTSTSTRTHEMFGNGSSVIASEFSGTYVGLSYGESGQPNVMIMDLLDYTNTNKNKVIRCLTGFDKNGSGQINLRSSVWLSNAAVTSIQVSVTGANTFAANSSFALYGVLA